MAGLLNFIQSGARQRFAWGSADCCLWVCDWVMQQRGIDPAAPLRGLYSTAHDAMRIAERAGGLDALIRQRFADAGLVETGEPKDGDVGMIAVPPDGFVLVVRYSGRWVGKSMRGVAGADVPHLAAWAV